VGSIFFRKALPICPAFSGAVLNKKPASAMRADLKNKAPQYERAKKQSPADPSNTDRRPVAKATFI
jgi:hypothetical protein